MADDTKTVPDPVPYERFQEVVSAKNTLSTEVTTLKGEVQKLTERAATADTLASQMNEWKGKAEQAEGRFSRFKDIASTLGTTDPDAIEAVEWQYGKLPTEGKPALPDWLKSVKEKPDEAPAILRPFLAAPTETKPEGAPDTKTPPDTRKPAPRANGGGPNPPGAPSAHSAAEIRKLREEAVRTNDWSKYKEASKGFTSRK
jgi:hypothetical protein